MKPHGGAPCQIRLAVGKIRLWQGPMTLLPLESNGLPDHGSERYKAALEELTRLQWKAASQAREATTFAGKPKTVLLFPALAEEYISQLPKMRDVATKNQLVRREFLIRQHAGDHPNLGDYRSRFSEINFDSLLSAEELRQADTVYRSPDERNVNTDMWPGSIEGYRVLERIGTGGMGAVCRAQQLPAVTLPPISQRESAQRSSGTERFALQVCGHFAMASRNSLMLSFWCSQDGAIN